MTKKFSKILKCPQTHNYLKAITKTGEIITQYDNFKDIVFLINYSNSRWYPVINNIPRILPDDIRDRKCDEKFYNEHLEIFSKLKINKSFFNDAVHDTTLSTYFNKQRFIWGKQPEWNSLYFTTIGYHSFDDKDRKKEVLENNNFFSKNLHCYYGDQPKFQDFIDEINHTNSKIVLDIGCGCGEKGKLIDNSKNKYIGIDIMGENGPDIQSSAYALPIADSRIDYVICDSVLEHVYDPLTVVNEISRVLKSGGKGYFVVPFSYKNHGAPFDFYRYTKSGLHTLLRNYSEISIYSFGGFIHALGHMLESFYPHLPMGLDRLIKGIHNSLFFFLNKLDKYDKYKLFSRGFYAFVTK